MYDATKCKLNQALWTPNFGLSTVDTIERFTHLTSWFGNSDIGGMFHNYFLDMRIRPYAGAS
eukprot:3074901-Ditylum_brightwellii.AAC.1